jgi:hypothetical protein
MPNEARDAARPIIRAGAAAPVQSTVAASAEIPAQIAGAFGGITRR